MHRTEDLATETPTELPPPTDELRLLASNLVGLVAAGGVVGAWFLLYTDLLPAIGGLLTITGGLAWSATLLNLVSDRRKEQLQSAFEERVLLDPGLWKTFAGLAVGLFVVTVLTASIEVDTLHDGEGRSLSVYRAGASPSQDEPIREVTLPARSQRKLLLFGYGPFLVKPSGLPATRVRGGIFWPEKVSSPDDFTRSPILLVRPDPALGFASLGSTALELEILRDDEALVGPMPFQGQGVWVGSDRDTAVPEWISRRWEKDQPVPWLPLIGADRPVVLEPGDELRIRLKATHGLYVPEVRHTVRSTNGPHDFVQEIVLAFPEDQG